LKDCSGAERDGCLSKYIPGKRRAGSQGRRTSDLPKDLARLGAINQAHDTAGCGGERSPDLEDELGIWVALGVERDSPSYSE
jgi:hypothetical protein